MSNFKDETTNSREIFIKRSILISWIILKFLDSEFFIWKMNELNTEAKQLWTCEFRVAANSGPGTLEEWVIRLFLGKAIIRNFISKLPSNPSDEQQHFTKRRRRWGRLSWKRFHKNPKQFIIHSHILIFNIKRVYQWYLKTYWVYCMLLNIRDKWFCGLIKNFFEFGNIFAVKSSQHLRINR